MQDELIAEYFGTYLDIDLANAANPVVVAFTQRRERPERGWGYAIPVWIFLTDHLVAISGGSTHSNQITEIQRVLDLQPVTSITPSFILQLLAQYFPMFRRVHHHVYSCTNTSIRPCFSKATRQLTAADIDAFIECSQSIYPAIDVVCETTDINRNIADGIAFGAFVAGKMVTRSYAPHIAHMQDRVEEIGVDTAKPFQGRGFGKAALYGTTRATLGIGRKPIYRTSSTNLASQRIAESSGYFKIADSIEVF